MAVHFVTENITNSSSFLPFLTASSGAFQSAINYFQSVLSVIRADHNLIIPPYCATSQHSNGQYQCTSVGSRICGPHVTIPDEHLGIIMVCDPTCREVGGNNTGVDADFLFYITVVDDGT